MNKHKTITRGFPIYRCRLCDKLTRTFTRFSLADPEEAYDAELCIECYEDAGQENTHNDTHNEDEMDMDCKHCRNGEFPYTY